ncbi:MAG: phage head closure protein [Chromatiales bacterium]
MTAGRYRHQITLQVKSATRDAIGGEVEVWTAFVNRYAAVEPLNGREYFTAKQELNDVTSRIRLRFDRQLSTLSPVNHRVVWGARIFDIESVINHNEADREIILMCRESI